LAAVLLAGCEQFFDRHESRGVKIPPERLQDIETLELKEAEEQENGRTDVNDVNQAPAKELSLTLEECRALTLENNLDLKVQLISPAIAAEKVSEQEAQFEAAFFSNVSYNKADTPSSTTLTGTKVDSAQTDLGVRVPLRTGGTITFDYVDARTKTNLDPGFLRLNPSYSSDLSVSISQPLLRGAGKRATTYSIRIAEYERQITDARTKLEVIRAIAAVDRVYWRLYAARKELEVRQKQYDLAHALFEQARRFVAAGDKPQVEVIRTEAGVAQQLEAIIISENNMRDRQRDLKRTLNKMGLEMQTPTALMPATEPDPIR
jgi:outer membrane protein TolC